MKISDEGVLDVIAQLRARSPDVSGVRLRRELAARFGARGGVARIYRLLKLAVPVPPVELAAVTERLRALELQRQQLAEALVVEESRREAAERRTAELEQGRALEVTELREALQAALGMDGTVNARELRILSLYRELHAAKRRIAVLERQQASAAASVRPRSIAEDGAGEAERSASESTTERAGRP